jgi:hypothetical protein
MGSQPKNDEARWEVVMYPGLADSDCWLAELHYRELVAEGQRQQVVSRACPTSGNSRQVSTVIQHLFGSFQMRVARLLPGNQAGSPKTLGSAVPATP